MLMMVVWSSLAISNAFAFMNTDKSFFKVSHFLIAVLCVVQFMKLI